MDKIMLYPFHRDFYKLVVNSIADNSVTFLLGPKKCGKTVCLCQLHDSIENSEYIDFKTIPDHYAQLNVLWKILDEIKVNKNVVYLLDEISYVSYADTMIDEIAYAFFESKNKNTKIVFTGSPSVALNAWERESFADNAGIISAEFLTYSEFLRYKELTTPTPSAYIRFLYETADFHKFNSLENYLKDCLEATAVANNKALRYIYDNECDHIKDNVELLISICYQTLIAISNPFKTDSFCKDEKSKKPLAVFREACKKIGNDKVASQLENAFVYSYNNIKSQDTRMLKESLMFLIQCGLISIKPIGQPAEYVPDVFKSLITDKGSINFQQDLLRKYIIIVNHPMLYVQILRKLLVKDIPADLLDMVLQSLAS